MLCCVAVYLSHRHDWCACYVVASLSRVTLNNDCDLCYVLVLLLHRQNWCACCGVFARHTWQLLCCVVMFLLHRHNWCACSCVVLWHCCRASHLTIIVLGCSVVVTSSRLMYMLWSPRCSDVVARPTVNNWLVVLLFCSVIPLVSSAGETMWWALMCEVRQKSSVDVDAAPHRWKWWIIKKVCSC